MSAEAAVEKSDLISVFIDGTEVRVPKGTLAIRAAEMIGVEIPRFCDHPLLDPVGACRQCLVEVPDAGNGRGFPKPQASCTLTVADGMKINTQETSEVARRAQEGILELLLINHPLDCPICDKGGECPLQNQAMSHGGSDSRYDGVKRTFPKPIPVSAQILLDRERCVLCARCTRFSEQISGDPFISLTERGALSQVGMFADQPYDSYFSGNVVQICPVGALTSADYRFQSRPFDLISTPTTCEHCASGCQLRTDQRHGSVRRRLAGHAPEINEEWNCDRGRFGFKSGRGDDRLTRPLVRRDGKLEVASWPEAIDAAVAGLQAAGSSVGVLTGGRLTLENAYGYAKFARVVLGTNNIDFRSRALSAEEADFLAYAVAGKTLGDGITYTDLEKAGRVVCVAFEAEEESPMLFLRMRKAVRKHGQHVVAVAPFLSNGNAKLNAELIPTLPGTEAEVVAGLSADDATIILVGERAATMPGVFTAALDLADRTGAKLAWVPRRAGDRGAIEAGCLPSLLPGGRPVADAAARVDVQAAWGADVPSKPGLDAEAMLAAAGRGEVKALVTAGIEVSDFADAGAVRDALDKAGFVVALEQRISEVTERADVVFPVALIEDQAGYFMNWEHRRGRVNRAVKGTGIAMSDLRVLAALADALGSDLGIRLAKDARAELDEIGIWEGARAARPVAPATAKTDNGLRLASWRLLLDGSSGIANDPGLSAMTPKAVARISPVTADQLGVAAGDQVSVGTDLGALILPVALEPTMVDGAVWLPGRIDGHGIGDLAAKPGQVVTVTSGGVA